MAQQIAAQIDIIATIQGNGANETWRLATYNPQQIADSTGITQTVQVASTGTGTFLAVPSSVGGTAATYCLILPDPGNAITISVKTTTADVGIATVTAPMLIPIAAGVTSISIKATGSPTTAILRWY